jgi:hypothetical protein
VDNFINDGTIIVPDLQDNQNQATQAMLLAIHVLCQPLASNEPISSVDYLSLGKLTEEGTLSECLMILGWNINTRLLTIALPTKKFKHWNADMKNIISTKKASYKKLESTLGRLSHAATACPIMRYFLYCIHQVLISWDTFQKNKK